MKKYTIIIAEPTIVEIEAKNIFEAINKAEEIAGYNLVEILPFELEGKIKLVAKIL